MVDTEYWHVPLSSILYRRQQNERPCMMGIRLGLIASRTIANSGIVGGSGTVAGLGARRPNAGYDHVVCKMDP